MSDREQRTRAALALLTERANTAGQQHDTTAALDLAGAVAVLLRDLEVMEAARRWGVSDAA